MLARKALIPTLVLNSVTSQTLNLDVQRDIQETLSFRDVFNKTVHLTIRQTMNFTDVYDFFSTNSNFEKDGFPEPKYPIYILQQSRANYACIKPNPPALKNFTLIPTIIIN